MLTNTLKHALVSVSADRYDEIAASLLAKAKLRERALEWLAAETGRTLQRVHELYCDNNPDTVARVGDLMIEMQSGRCDCITP